MLDQEALYSLLRHCTMVHEGDSTGQERLYGVAEVAMSGPPLPREDKPIPLDVLDRWRSEGLSEAEIQTKGLVWRAFRLNADSSPFEAIVSPVADLQRRAGKKLRDLTWAEALEVFIENRRRDLLEIRALRRRFDEKDWGLREAERQTMKVLRRAQNFHQEWLAVRRTGLRGLMLAAYQSKVFGYYESHDEYMREPTARSRRKAKSLKRELDEDAEVIKLRYKTLRIPEDGFQDVDQAARWLYDRYPPSEPLWPYGPTGTVLWEGPSGVYVPSIMEVSVLAEATRRLRKHYEEKKKEERKEYELDPKWDVVLCFYLLRGKLDPLPRKIRRWERPMADLHQEVYELSEKYKPAHKVVLYWVYRLTDEDWSEIVARYPAAAKKKWSQGQKEGIKKEAEKIAKRTGSYDTRREWLTEDNVRTIRDRMREMKKM